MAAENPEVFRAHLRRMLRDGPMATPASRANIERFRQFKEEGRLQPEVDPFIGAMLAVSAELAALMVMQSASSQQEAVELARRFSIAYHRLLFHGIMEPDAPAGRTRRRGLSEISVADRRFVWSSPWKRGSMHSA